LDEDAHRLTKAYNIFLIKPSHEIR